MPACRRNHLDRFVEEVARVVGVQKAVVFREALYVLAEEESVLTQKRLAPDTLRRLDEMNDQLRRIGVNLNQLARRANIDGVACSDHRFSNAMVRIE